MVAFAMLARLLVVALISMVVAGLMITRLMIARAVAVAGEGRRWRLWDKTRFLAEIREILAVVLAVVTAVVADGLVAARLLVLPELFLSRRDQTKIMLGMLVVVLGRNGVSGGARVARELEILFSNMRSRAADLDVRSVGTRRPGSSGSGRAGYYCCYCYYYCCGCASAACSDRFSCPAFNSSPKGCTHY
ncbi:hypothetical protein ACVWZL_007405 [Bradyrhizobium sp. GM2.4]